MAEFANGGIIPGDHTEDNGPFDVGGSGGVEMQSRNVVRCYYFYSGLAAVIQPHYSHWSDVKRKHIELQRTRTLDYLFDVRD